MKALEIIATLLVVIGALNWGLVGLFQFNLVSAILSTLPMLMNTVYVLVALSGLLVAYFRLAAAK